MTTRLGDLQIFAGVTSQEALRQRLRGEVETEVAAMLDAIQEFDAFDVIELMRLRELTRRPGRSRSRAATTAVAPQSTWSHSSACPARQEAGR